MKTITTKVYTLNELNDDAKEKARNWAREFVFDFDWHESLYDHARTIGLEITSFDLDRNRHAKGTLLKSPVEVAEAILKEHGNKTDTYILADAFLAHREHASELDIEDEEFERALIEEYSVLLQKEYESMNEDAYLDDMIGANEYTFTESGKRFG